MLTPTCRVTSIEVRAEASPVAHGSAQPARPLRHVAQLSAWRRLGTTPGAAKRPIPCGSVREPCSRLRLNASSVAHGSTTLAAGVRAALFLYVLAIVGAATLAVSALVLALHLAAWRRRPRGMAAAGVPSAAQRALVLMGRDGEDAEQMWALVAAGQPEALAELFVEGLLNDEWPSGPLGGWWDGYVLRRGS